MFDLAIFNVNCFEWVSPKSTFFSFSSFSFLISHFVLFSKFFWSWFTHHFESVLRYDYVNIIARGSVTKFMKNKSIGRGFFFCGNARPTPSVSCWSCSFPFLLLSLCKIIFFIEKSSIHNADIKCQMCTVYSMTTNVTIAQLLVWLNRWHQWRHHILDHRWFFLLQIFGSNRNFFWLRIKVIRYLNLKTIPNRLPSNLAVYFGISYIFAFIYLIW